MSKENDDSDLPIEVQLVSGVKNCETCKWFWGDDRPYGPYPSYDFLEKYPKNEKIKYNEKAKKPIPWIKTKSNALKFVEPAVMQGCRKAPIMTIGINPNLTAFKPNPRNDTWAYPKFSNQASYAYYYRYKTIYQESFSGDFLQKQMSKKEKEIVRAKMAGYLTYSQRSNTSRWMMLKIRYEDDTEETIERTWKSREDYFVRYFASKNKKIQFKKGDIIAAKLHLKKDLKAEAFHNVTGYYARFVPVLDSFKKLIVENGDKKQLKKMNLTVGEDVAMHDMIGCASPGWTSIYDIPTERVIENCVEDNAWVIKQVIQSQPKVIVLVGGSSMAMFLGIFGPYTNVPKDRDYFEKVRETCEKPYLMKIKIGKFAFTSRIICTPHFSYGDNFEKHVRLSSEEWYELREKHPKELKIILRLNKAKKITIKEGYGSSQMIMLKKGKEELEKIVEKFSPKVKKLFLKNYFDVTEMIAQALKQEYDKRNLQFDEKTGHLERTEGPCHYCKNDSWEFPEGCEYGNADEKPVPAKFYLEITEKIVRKGVSRKKQNELRWKREAEKRKREMYEVEAF